MLQVATGIPSSLGVFWIMLAIKVKELALKIAENHKVDREVVVLASLLHDIGYI